MNHIRKKQYGTGVKMALTQKERAHEVKAAFYFSLKQSHSPNSDFFPLYTEIWNIESTILLFSRSGISREKKMIWWDFLVLEKISWSKYLLGVLPMHPTFTYFTLFSFFGLVKKTINAKCVDFFFPCFDNFLKSLNLQKQIPVRLLHFHAQKKVALGKGFPGSSLKTSKSTLKIF